MSNLVAISIDDKIVETNHYGGALSDYIEKNYPELSVTGYDNQKVEFVNAEDAMMFYLRHHGESNTFVIQMKLNFDKNNSAAKDITSNWAVCMGQKI